MGPGVGLAFAGTTNAVQEYNTGIQQMPAALFAGMIGFTRRDFFDLGASRTEVKAVPTVKF
jgi:LemA protein